MISELNIIDEDGIITCSTVDEYNGLDMRSGEQSNAFMAILDDPSIEIVQEPHLHNSTVYQMIDHKQQYTKDNQHTQRNHNHLIVALCIIFFCRCEMQYIGVARTDAAGFVQVGIRPEVLEEMLAGKKIQG